MCLPIRPLPHLLDHLVPSRPPLAAPPILRQIALARTLTRFPISQKRSRKRPRLLATNRMSTLSQNQMRLHMPDNRTHARPPLKINRLCLRLSKRPQPIPTVHSPVQVHRSHGQAIAIQHRSTRPGHPRLTNQPLISDIQWAAKQGKRPVHQPPRSMTLATILK